LHVVVAVSSKLAIFSALYRQELDVWLTLRYYPISQYVTLACCVTEQCSSHTQPHEYCVTNSCIVHIKPTTTWPSWWTYGGWYVESRLGFESRFVTDVFVVTSVCIPVERIKIMSVRLYAWTIRRQLEGFLWMFLLGNLIDILTDRLQIWHSTFMWPCIVICSCNKTNEVH
jgi:hypothetical protein